MKRKFKVLYTHQKTKKKKTWQDGLLTLAVDEKIGFLTDEDKTSLSTVYIRNKKVENGLELDCGKYLIQVDEEVSGNSPQQSQPAKQTTEKIIPAKPLINLSNSQSAVSKKRGFTVPRKVPVLKQPVVENCLDNPAPIQHDAMPMNSAEKSIWNEVVPMNKGNSEQSPKPSNHNIRDTEDVLKMLGCTDSKFKMDQGSMKAEIQDYVDSSEDSIITMDFLDDIPTFSSLRPAGDLELPLKCPKLQLRPKTQFWSKHVKEPAANEYKIERKLATEIQERMGRELFFPTHQDIRDNSDQCEGITKIPTMFSSADDYVSTWRKVVREHLNLQIWLKCKEYHGLMENADMSKSLQQSGVLYSYSSHPERSSEIKSPNIITPDIMGDEDALMLGEPPYCDHEAPCRLNRVRKEGVNMGRMFYACARKKKCKFFKWAEVPSLRRKASSSLAPPCNVVKINNERALVSYLLRNGVTLFPGCTLSRKSPDIEDKNIKNQPSAKCLFLQLSREDRTLRDNGTKDSVLAISSSMDFKQDTTELYQVVANKPTNLNELVVQPLNTASSKLLNEEKVVVLFVCKATCELASLRSLQHNIENLPLLPTLLNSAHKQVLSIPTNPILKRKSTFKLEVSYDDLVEISRRFINKYKLDSQQTKGIDLLVDMLIDRKIDSQVLLIDGVVGSGKTFLLAVFILFIAEVITANQAAQESNKSKKRWKVMVTSKSNSVIDSVFHHLIRLGYERIIRIADLDKIDRSLLPYALHALGGTQEHTKKLQKMLQSSNQSMPGNHYIHKSLDLVRGGSPKRLLHNATVVGATCRDVLSSCIGSYDFPIVIIDDATETPELSSLLPLAKFGVQKLLLGGDSARLTNQEAAFSQSVFSRLNKSSENSVKLTTHYRCHNDVIDVINNAFYDDVIISGLSSSDRPKLVAGLPNFCFYDVTGASGNNEQHHPHEALFVADIIRLLMSHGVPGTSVVVLTTDQTQVKQVQSALQEIEFYDLSDVNCIRVTTMEDYEGGETMVSIVVCPRSTGTNDTFGNIISLLTRGSHHNLAVGNIRELSNDHKWSKLINVCKEKGRIQSSFQFRKLTSSKGVAFSPEVPFSARRIDGVIGDCDSTNDPGNTDVRIDLHDDVDDKDGDVSLDSDVEEEESDGDSSSEDDLPVLRHRSNCRRINDDDDATDESTEESEELSENELDNPPKLDNKDTQSRNHATTDTSLITNDFNSVTSDTTLSSKSSNEETNQIVDQVYDLS